MLKLFFVLFQFGFLSFGFCQEYDPVTWNVFVKKISATDFEVKYVAKVEYPWHIYSKNTKGGYPTKINIGKHPLIKTVSSLVEKGILKLKKVRRGY